VLILAATPALSASGSRGLRSGDVAAGVEVDIGTLQLLSPDLGHRTARLSCAHGYADEFHAVDGFY
jgi:hypothetical protein